MEERGISMAYIEGLLEDSADPLYDELIKRHLDQRKVVFNRNVDDSIMEDVTLRILQWNLEDKHIPPKERQPIWIYIQSPGGDVISGFNLIDAINASLTPIYTVCFSDCASMAFHIFISGHKRFCFKNSVLLIHDGQISINNSTSKAKDTMKFIEGLDQRTKQHVLDHTKITSEFYDSIYDTEYYIFGNNTGKELGCVDYIVGEDVEITNIL